MTFNLHKRNTVFKSKGKCGYFSVCRNPNTKKVFMYYRSAKPPSPGLTMPTKYLESADGIHFIQPEDSIIIKNTGACHNFFGFYDSNPASTLSYRGIGGTHWRKKDPFWRIREKFKGIKKNTPETHGWRGLYTYHSCDGIKWDQTCHKPKLCRRAENFQTRGRLQSREFDSHLCAFYDPAREHYILYTRANVDAGIRHIQYTTSKDFDRWNPFSLVQFKPSFNYTIDNYYSPNFQIHPDQKRYMGLLPYCRGKYACLRFVISRMGTKWKLVKDFFIQKSWYDNGELDKPKNPCHPVNGYIVSNDGNEIYFYVQHNYFNHVKREPVKIVRYSVPLKEFMLV